MTFSSLISGTVPHNNKYSSRQGVPVTRVIQHHFAGTSDARLRGTDKASANYIIYNDGTILGHIPEEYRPWTSGSFEADAGSITYEVQNSSFQVNGNDSDPASWQVSDKAYDAIIRLTADVAKRHGFGAVTPTNYQGHRQWFATACPGGFLWARMDNTRAQANAILTQSPAAPAPKVPPVAGKTIWQLADEVIAGHYGSGEARKKALGAQYDAVQAEVNRRHGVGPLVPAKKTVAQLADEVLAGKHGTGAARQKSLGNLYAAVQNEINRRIGGGGVAPKGVNISALADAVMRGAYGAGDARKRRLGVHYDAVQQEVNRRLGAGPSPVANIKALADAVIRGEYGSGEERKRRLGKNYAAVQAEVNRRFA